MLIQVLIGILQGIFEWLPISSEGIVALFGQLFVENVNAVDVAIFLHLGTLFAVLIYFSKDWRDVLVFRDKSLLKFLVIATVVSLTVGYPVYKLVRSIAFGSVLLLIMGIGLLITAYFHKSNKNFGLNKTWLAVITGALQGLAVIPGLSRSGSTIFGLSLGDLKPRQVLKFSYMMSAPVILAAAIFLVLKNPDLLNGWVALVSSFIAGILSLHTLMKFSKRINFFKFTLIFGILCFIGAGISFVVL